MKEVVFSPHARRVAVRFTHRRPSMRSDADPIALPYAKQHAWAVMCRNLPTETQGVGTSITVPSGRLCSMLVAVLRDEGCPVRC